MSKKKKKCYPLIFLYSILILGAIRPELSSPAHFRIEGGSPERDGVVVVGVVIVVVAAGRNFFSLI